jgi:hypothetical protein
MANLHTYQPTASEIAGVVIAEAKKSLVDAASVFTSGGGPSVAQTIGLLFATSHKDRPHKIDDHHLFVALAVAVLRQAHEIDGLKAALAGVEKHARELDHRTVGQIRMGPSQERLDEAEAARETAYTELVEALEKDPEFQKVRDKLAERRQREAAQPPAPPPVAPHPTGGFGE